MTYRSLITSALLLAVALPVLAGSAGCKKKTPAQKLGDKIEDVGHEVEEEVDG